MAAFAEGLRTGAWITRERVRLVAWAILVASLIGFAWLVATSNGLIDRQGRPLGTDFSNVYAAGTYVLEGRPEAPFDPRTQLARERAIFGNTAPFYGWHYPPFFLAIAAFLALMPYLPALAAWQGTTLALYLWSMRAIAADRSHLWLLLALAYPAVFINLGHGHNGFLTAGLVAFGLLLLRPRPWLAGILFGCLAYKPQFGLLIPFALVAGGYWRTFLSAAITVVLFALAVTLAFGPDVWRAFLASTEFTRRVVLEQGDTGWEKIQSVFAWMRMWGGSIGLAYAVQTATSIAAALAVMWLWRGKAAFPLKAAALLIATVLATPYSLDYDLMLLAPAIAFLVVDGSKRGFDPYQKSLLAALWIVPLIARSAGAALIPLAVPLMLANFVFVLRRGISPLPRVGFLPRAP